MSLYPSTKLSVRYKPCVDACQFDLWRGGNGGVSFAAPQVLSLRLLPRRDVCDSRRAALRAIDFLNCVLPISWKLSCRALGLSRIAAPYCITLHHANSWAAATEVGLPRVWGDVVNAFNCYCDILQSCLFWKGKFVSSVLRLECRNFLTWIRRCSGVTLLWGGPKP